MCEHVTTERRESTIGIPTLLTFYLATKLFISKLTATGWAWVIIRQADDDERGFMIQQLVAKS